MLRVHGLSLECAFYCLLYVDISVLTLELVHIPFLYNWVLLCPALAHSTVCRGYAALSPRSTNPQQEYVLLASAALVLVLLLHTNLAFRFKMLQDLFSGNIDLASIASCSVDEGAAASLMHFIQNGPSSPRNDTAHPEQRPITGSPKCSKGGSAEGRHGYCW
ncbi:hypothetical protein L208DRAFT_1401084 [Tricholoma matsutake]|nr:hypothetical protein L208DRAFT_1401084 [Tricholoma matsutake 945]